MASEQREDPLAYGDYHDQRSGENVDDPAEGERGFVGDTFRRLRGRYQGQTGSDSGHDPNSAGGSQPSGPSGTSDQPGGLGSSLFNKLHGAVHDLGSEIKQRLDGRPGSSQGLTSPGTVLGAVGGTQNRFGSFAETRSGNDAKWYVDGCGYMWAVSVAIEQARESIWILDCEFVSIISDLTANSAVVESLLRFPTLGIGPFC